MLKQLIDEKSNEIFVLQTAGKGTSCPACVWQTVLHAGTAVHTADVCEPALSLSRAHVYLTLWFTIKPPYSIAHDKLQLAIWDTSFWTFLLKFGHKGP